jgi:uncharacterized protein YndB with AHSA1/START domain
MVTVSRRCSVAPRRVWEVLADGWSYAGWVVGTHRIRAVEPGWPAVGTKIHHSAGSWPLLINDETEVVEAEPGHSITLQARGWPFGEATVTVGLTLKGYGTLIEISEDVTAGPSRIVPQPLRQLGIAPRNTETLRRLAFLAERHQRPQ